MTSLLQIYILWFTICVDYIRAIPHINVPVRVGSTALLPCNLSVVPSQTPQVIWRANDEFVFERWGNKSEQGKRYKGRVDIPEDELRKGNCSMVLKNVKALDDGNYQTFEVEYKSLQSQTSQLIGRVTLIVDVTHNVSALVDSTVILPCEWRNIFTDTPEVEWSINTETVFDRKGGKFFHGEGYEGRVDVPEDELNNGNCSLVLKNVSDTDEAVYKSYVKLKREKKLASKVHLFVYDKPVEGERSGNTGESGIRCPPLLILIISFIMCLLFSYFI